MNQSSEKPIELGNFKRHQYSSRSYRPR